MVRNVFLLGRPGSGKSSVAQLINMLANDKGWITHHIYDYKLLQEMFLQETTREVSPGERSFKPKGPRKYCGFDVVKFSVLDTVLELMAEEVRKEMKASPQGNKLFLIEFARDDYSHALQRFGCDLLRDAHLLYLLADVEPCVDRIRKRVECQSAPCNHFVSDKIMKGYYSKDDWSESWLEEFLSLPQNRGIYLNASTIDNTGSTGALLNRIVNVFSNHLISELTLST